jgi:hypothetical protein
VTLVGRLRGDRRYIKSISNLKREGRKALKKMNMVQDQLKTVSTREFYDETGRSSHSSFFFRNFIILRSDLHPTVLVFITYIGRGNDLALSY